VKIIYFLIFISIIIASCSQNKSLEISENNFINKDLNLEEEKKSVNENVFIDKGQILELTNPKMNGNAVEQLQKDLLYMGYWLGNDGIDGWFGQDTEKAVIQYETDQNMEIDGKIGSENELVKKELLITMQSIDEEPDIIEVNSLSKSKIGYFFNIFDSLEFRTYFGKFYITPIADNIYSSSRFDFNNVLDHNDQVYLTSELYLSPTGRFVSSLELDNYAGEGIYSIMIIDILSEEIKRIKFPINEIDQDIGLRDSVYKANIKWISSNSLAFNFFVDYQQLPAHPGMDEPWKEKLGELAGTTDPIDAGWFLLTIDTNEEYYPNNFAWPFTIDSRLNLSEK